MNNCEAQAGAGCVVLLVHIETGKSHQNGAYLADNSSSSNSNEAICWMEAFTDGMCVFVCFAPPDRAVMMIG